MARTPRPPVTIASDTLDRLERLAEAAMARNPELADRLLAELARARVLPPARMPADVAGIGSAVTFRDETTGREQTVVLVWPEDADIAAARASVLTPIGVALIGLRAGARFTWDTRAGETRELTVLSVGRADPVTPAA
ncbi:MULTISPECIES: nucleoside diphosphate kinase regulator [Paracoccus]|uniref:GreA/GreB family elongation factor n=1 Tax=Paracoccus denitrificans (strain Pd 1222) TaxID=318586 RepID=A1BB91_PARDP|nr:MULTISPECIES: nucleoside diphosphate kinase regulator [Paracoccus]ABL72785.1 GreA/GreB family elongation factor [Paracoccus denitrificans PD1222]MBB4626263.1 regulator of nucleoside diphosphate kinase [Paracoccus denitrificans]MCU7427531.1 nucleoside diphosphate kinase regulator [Paracoccus denitrificans]MDK8871113.1 nucleoside diphosphate kinase regulator [Paracoccus sp. SSJ]QAR29745.1 nucleoside diphosphate kinase regulator [Paracoccus denitrificans]